MIKHLKKFGWWSALLALAFATVVLPIQAAAQDDQGQGDDPPTRVARLGYMEGSVSFQPAGEQDWVQAVSNRPMTTGDKLWADKGSRAELQLGSAVIRLSENTGFSFLNLDDHTVQIQLTSGTLNLRVRRLDQNDAYEVDTPNLAFTIDGPGNYRLEASEDGTNTAVSSRDGQGEATGNGQTYTIHAGQRATFSGTDSLNADVENNNNPDQFDTWGDGRDHRYEGSRSAQYLSHDVVGYEDLDDNGDWRDDSNYGHVWYPSHVEAGWAPYHEGHWDWISPWGYTWVDDSNWGYAPFHYGRWVSVSGRWGWVAGPVETRAVYAPALVVFLGGGPGGFGEDVGWFPLGPREVYVPPYQVSRGYMNRVNISNTNVTTTNITTVYNTTIINKSTTITNVNYANRGVQGAVTVVPQRAFAGAQPVGRAAVAVNAQQLSRAQVNARVAVAPTRESVLGAKASSAGHVSAPPAAVANRQVIAKRTPPPPPVPFAKQQQAMAAHPGQPLPRREMQSLRPANAEAAHPMVKQAPPGKPATMPTGHPMNNGRPGQPGQPAAGQPGNQPGNRPGNPPAQNERPGAANPAGQPNRPNQPENRPGSQPNQPNNANRPPAPGQPNQPNNRPEANRPPAPGQPNQPNNRPEANRPPAPGQPNQPNNRPEANRPPAAGQPNQPNNRPEANRPPVPGQPNQPNNRPEANRPPAPGQPNQPNNRPEANRPPAPGQPNQPNNRPEANRPPAAGQPNQPTNRPEVNRPPAPGQPNQPNNRPEANRPPAPGQPNQPNNRPEANRPPAAQPNNKPSQPEPARPPQANRPAEPPAQNNRPAAQPNRPEPKPAQPAPQPNRPEPKPAQPAARPAPPPPAQHAPERTPPPAQSRPAPPPPAQHAPERTPPPAAKPAPAPAHPQTPQEKKQQEEEKKKPPVA